MIASSRDRLEQALSRITDPKGEGARACLTLYTESARDAADAADRRALSGRALGPLDGAIVSIKDLFDVAGEPTRAGSKVLADAPPAAADAVIVERLRRAGAVIVGKTSMSEFAFTGVGANPHYGTPANPADRARVPGGSSSGAAVAVADGMCEIAVGTDTGGSTRIPAALCGIVGFKPTKSRIPTRGAFPLSPTLDSVGPIAGSVAACAIIDAAMAGEEPWHLAPVPLAGLRFAIPQGLPLDDLDPTVETAFAAALARLGQAGVTLSGADFALFDDMDRVNANGTIATVEAFQIHRDRLAAHRTDYDPLVASRIELGSKASVADHARMLDERTTLARAMDARFADFDAMVLPTTPIVAPALAEIAEFKSYNRCNRLLLRNTAIANFFDLCAISLPLPRGDGLPTGLMLVARHGHDRQLFRMATAVERLFA